jgi:hypothetical protein
VDDPADRPQDTGAWLHRSRKVDPYFQRRVAGAGRERVEQLPDKAVEAVDAGRLGVHQDALAVNGIAELLSASRDAHQPEAALSEELLDRGSRRHGSLRRQRYQDPSRTALCRAPYQQTPVADRKSASDTS